MMMGLDLLMGAALVAYARGEISTDEYYTLREQLSS
jgi:uncharacterized membrane protein